jgi:hypothetical protein
LVAVRAVAVDQTTQVRVAARVDSERQHLLAFHLGLITQ